MLGTKEITKIVFPKKKIVITAMERIANENIQESMNFKLNFKKNPHNDPKTIKNVLIKKKMNNNIENNNNKHDTSHHGNNNDTTQNYGNSFHSIKSVNQNSVNDSIPLFVADPKIIEFNEYAIGDVMKLNLSLLNISTISRTVRIVPPGGGRFGIAPLIYPSGMINMNA